jgi:hypothetical protein
MHELVCAGREAIEKAILEVVIRPWVKVDDGQVDVGELRTLLVRYNQVMTKYEKPQINPTAANDEQGAAD